MADDLRAGLVEDGRLAFDDRDQRIAPVTDPKEHVADLRAPLLAVLGEQGELSLGEPRRPGCHARTLSPARVRLSRAGVHHQRIAAATVLTEKPLFPGALRALAMNVQPR